MKTVDLKDLGNYFKTNNDTPKSTKGKAVKAKRCRICGNVMNLIPGTNVWTCTADGSIEYSDDVGSKDYR